MREQTATDTARSAERLTQREVQILRLLAGGCSDAEIGLSLQISPATVRAHLENVRAKLHAANRVQLVATAFRRALIH